MHAQGSSHAANIAEAGCLTPFGDARQTLTALLDKQKALTLSPVLGSKGGDLVPLALLPGRSLEESPEPAWLPALLKLLAPVQDRPWGTPDYPVFITSSNFGVGSLLAFKTTGDPAFLRHGSSRACLDWLCTHLNWGRNLTAFSHACVSAHLGLMQAERMLTANLATEVLVLSFDFLSPFVAGGFHALKILNSEFPAPYQQRETGAIGLGEGAGFVVLNRKPSAFRIEGQWLHNEMFHFTANQPDGEGFRCLLSPLSRALAGRRLWLKGHGTGTLEAGRLEASQLSTSFPGAPLVGWKGSLGHTLGSCGLIELLIGMEAIRAGRSPGTIGCSGPAFSPEVASEAFPNGHFNGLLCLSNAFGGAHAALLLGHD